MQKNIALLASGLDENDWIVQRYHIIKEIGQGAFGNVYKAIDLSYASKNLDKTQTEQENFDQFVAIKKIFYDRKYVQREVPMLMEIRKSDKCDNIIMLKDRYLKVNSAQTDKKNPAQPLENLYIITDFMPFTICDLNLSAAIYSQG